MLNGLAPIFLFNFYKLSPSVEAFIQKIPVVDSLVAKVGLPPIPLYLDETLTGIYIESESKNIDIETTTETLSNGADPVTNQKAINSIVTINMIASKDSIGMTLLSAMADVILPKVTSREYSITYLHEATTVFNGLLHSFAINSNSNDTLYQVQIQLSRSTSKTKVAEEIPVVGKSTGALPL